MIDDEPKQLYVTHSKNFDFKNQLYYPIRNSSLNTKFRIALPHEFSDSPFSSKKFISSCYKILAEVSFPSTGQGIELGWADAYSIPIICFYRTGSKPAGSLKTIADIFLEYSSPEEMINLLENKLGVNKQL